PRVPRSTLFPYTTLFRSLDDVWATWDGRTTQAAVGVKNFGAGQVVLVGSAVFGSTGGFDPYPGLNAWVFGEEHLREQFEYYRLGDRKSTRLNSSHVKISY